MDNELLKYKANCSLIVLGLLSNKSASEILRIAIRHRYTCRGMKWWNILQAARELGIEGVEMELADLIKIGWQAPTRPTYDRRGVCRRVCIQSAKNKGWWWSEKLMTISQFQKRYTYETYIIRVDGHVLIVHEGMMIDPNFNNSRPKRKVRSAFKVFDRAFDLAIAA